jgi:hypothetical protein
MTQQNIAVFVFDSDSSDEIKAENPQSPHLDTNLREDTKCEEYALFMDPDRPPISKSDIKKLQNSVKAKAKKTPEEIEKLREIHLAKQKVSKIEKSAREQRHWEMNPPKTKSVEEAR